MSEVTDPAADGWVPLTTHEIFYLLSLGDGSANEMSRERLGIPQTSESIDMTLAGATTLLVRGMADVVGETVEPVDQAALMAWLLSTASTWLEVGATVGSAADALLVLSNDDAGAVLAPASLGIFRMIIIDPGDRPAEVALSFAEGILTRNADAAVSARRFGLDGVRSAGVTTESGSWSLVKTLPGGVHDGLTPIPMECTRAEAVGLLESVLK